MKFSKKFSGTSLSKPNNFYHSTPSSAAKSSAQSSNNEKLDATPVRENEIAAKRNTLAVKTPTIASGKFENYSFFNSIPAITTSTNLRAKVFSLNTGLPNNEPVIVTTSEFRPIYSGEKKVNNGSNTKNELGKILSLKEAAGLINARTAITILSQSEDTKEVIKSAKNQLLTFAGSQDKNIVQLMKELNEALNALDVTSYKMGTKGFLSNSNSNSISSIYEILVRGGYTSKEISTFTETKMWQQALVEVKKIVMTHTPGLLSQKFTRVPADEDDSPFRISDVEDPPPDAKNLWINTSYDNLPTLAMLTSQQSIMTNVDSLLKFHDRQYVNFANANVPTKITKAGVVQPTGRNARSALPKFQGKQNDTPNFFSSEILAPFVTSGRDISIMAHILRREALYSTFLLDDDNATSIARRFNYTVDPEGNNMKVWDYVIGKFPKSVLDFIENPVGNGNSLVSLSQKVISSGQDSYNVLTFENNFIENQNITPGTYYYVDSAINTPDGTNFDTTRLEKLISDVSNAYSTTTMMLDMLGYTPSMMTVDIQGTGEVYRSKQTKEVTSLQELVSALSIVTDNYRDYMQVTEKQITGLLSTTSQSIRQSSVRLAALICKLAVEPEESYKTRSNSLKSMLFLWLMNIVMTKAEGVANGSTRSAYRNAIINTITSNQLRITSDLEVDTAMREGRVYTTSVTNITGEAQVDFGTEIGDQDNGLNLFQELYLNAVEQQANEQLQEAQAERQKVFQEYQDAIANRIFSINTDTGLWKVIVDLLRKIYDSSNIYTEQDVTAYSGINRIAYLYSYFELILRIIAAQTPENLLGTYKKNIEKAISPEVLLTDKQRQQADVALQSTGIEWDFGTGDITKDRPPLEIQEMGLIIDKVDSSQLNGYFDYSKINVATAAVRRLSNAISFSNIEELDSVRVVSIFRTYLAYLNKALISYRSYLNQDFEKYLAEIRNLLASDTGLSQPQKNALINLAITEEQLKLSRYVMSEYSDRIKTDDSSSKLKTLPAFSTFPEGYYDFLSVSETDHVSYTLLSSYFGGNEFLSFKGNNKKIISVGIPQKMVKTLNTSVRLGNNVSKGLQQGIIRIKVWKLDKLHPDIVYSPKSYLFEVNRFPTRVLGNWGAQAFSTTTTNLLEIPSKVIYPNGNIVLNRDFRESFPESDYGNYLDNREKLEVYTNHAMSFLMEEYHRWFTDLHLEETRYYNFAPLSPDMKAIKSQYDKYVKSVLNDFKKSQSNIEPYPEASTNKPGLGYKSIFPNQKSKIVGNFGTIKAALPLAMKKITQGTIDSLKKSKPKDKFVIPMDDTIQRFFENETFMTDMDDLKKRALYPKKFDRVFNIMIDPDDFYVDVSMTDPDVIRALVSENVLSKSISGKTRGYKHRDTSQNDVWLDEYFVTIEPFDYTPEYEV